MRWRSPESFEGEEGLTGGRGALGAMVLGLDGDVWILSAQLLLASPLMNDWRGTLRSSAAAQRRDLTGVSLGKMSGRPIGEKAR